jgi:protein involved in polysaccharide export with SLBB domain
VFIGTTMFAAGGLAVGQVSDQSVDQAREVAPASSTQNPSTGPIRLRQSSIDPLQGRASQGRSRAGDPNDRERREPAPPPRLSEFEVHVNRLAFPLETRRPGTDVQTEELGIRRPGADLPMTEEPPRIRRLGADLMTDEFKAGQVVDYSPLVPPDYLISAGDEIVLSIWGSVDAELRLTVDRSGRISVPRAGTILVSGVRYADLPAVISQRLAQVFKNFQLSVSLGQLRGVRVYVTGFVERPGAYTVNGLSSIANALVRAGGPSASGSFRNIQLRRGRELVSTLDFYDLLLKGDRSHDKLVQADDVIHIGPIGIQVAVIGSVNRPAIYELKPDETIVDLQRMTGGFSAVADRSRFSLERIDDRATVRVVQVDIANAATTELRNGDVLRAFNAVVLATAVGKQNKRVRVEGEVLRPGEYLLPPNSAVADALRAAGGLTASAFVFGTDFSRESVRVTQQENYERALRDLEVELERSSSTQRVTSAEEAAAINARSLGTARLLAKLRGLKPSGRVVLQIQPDARELPNLVLEDGDRLFIPPVPSSVGVFGSIFNAGNYLRVPDLSLSDYLRLAGGPTRGADSGSTFVIRANGTVVSNLQEKTWGSGLSSNFERLPALPGDTLFVPEETDKTTFVQYAKDWTQILYQFALGAAAFVTLTN